MATKEVTKLSELVGDVQITNPVTGQIMIWNGSAGQWQNATMTPYYSQDQVDSFLSDKANTLHSHAQGDVSGLSDALAGKAAYNHYHAISHVTGLATALDAKSDDTHSHPISKVTGLQAALDGKSGTDHNHDSEYYTQAEIDTSLAQLGDMGNMTNIDNADVALTTGQWYQTRTSGTKGDGTPIAYTMPAIFSEAADAGKWEEFICGHADLLRIYPGEGRELIINGESTGTDGTGYIEAYGVGDVVKVMYKGSNVFIIKTGSGCAKLVAGAS